MALPEIAPSQVARFPLTVRFPGAGPHDLSLELPEDELPGDNQRWVAVPVKDSLLIRLVDGEPSSEPFGGEVDYLAAPLSIGVGEAEAWRVEVVQEEDFLSPRLEPADVLVLANVAAPTPEQAERLGQLVRDGMGLMIFTGGRVDTGLYNDLLDRDEVPILPARMKALVDEPSPRPDRRAGPPVAAGDAAGPEGVGPGAGARSGRSWRSTKRTDEGEGEVRVLARWNDPGRSPAVVERIVGDGRVLLWTTTADRDGNDWPVEPSFVLAVREAVRGTARPTSLANNVTAGEPLRRVVHSSQQVANVQLTPPGGRRAALPGGGSRSMRRPSTGEPAVAIDVADTRRAGLYRLAWEEGPLGLQQDLYAANPDARESALERIEPEDLREPLETAGRRGRAVAGGRCRAVPPDRPRDLATSWRGACSASWSSSRSWPPGSVVPAENEPFWI